MLHEDTLARLILNSEGLGNLLERLPKQQASVFVNWYQSNTEKHAVNMSESIWKRDGQLKPNRQEGCENLTTVEVYIVR